VRVHIDDATPYTLFGTVETAEVVGVACDHEPATAEAGRRIGLPLI
jgi:hypothetical protein